MFPKVYALALAALLIPATSLANTKCTTSERTYCVPWVENGATHVIQISSGEIREFMSACWDKKDEACMLLGKVFRDAEAPNQDIQASISFLSPACERGHSWSCLELRRSFTRQGEPQKALYAVTRSCDLGNQAACLEVGELMEEGIGGTPKDAHDLYARACEMGRPAGCIRQGRMLKHGDAYKKDLVTAYKLFEKTCDMRHMSGCFELGLADFQKYLDDPSGPNANVYLTEASGHLVHACEVGHAFACTRIGIALFNEHDLPVPFDARHYIGHACDLKWSKACEIARLMDEEAAKND